MAATALGRLLIVDDDAVQVKALCDTLEGQGYIAAGFASSHEALAALLGRKFDLLLTDLKMPEMDGVALLRAALLIDPDLIGIMITGQGTIGTAVEAMQAGALDYILKPYKLSGILHVLRRAMAVRQLRLEKAALEQRVRERTAELESANKELDAFSYSVSHDLRAPLRAIGEFSQMLLDNVAPRLSPEDRHLLQRVHGGAEKMKALIEGLLHLSRLGRQPLSKQPLQLSKLVRQVVDESGKEQAGRQVEIRVNDLPDCVGDAPLVKQVVVNLLSNALKFTRHKEKALIEIGCTQREGETVYFIRDNGAGFDMQYAQTLFGAFQRFHRPEEFDGSGIGLSIVQRVIHRHGGRIWAEAQVNQGAAFFFTLASSGSNPLLADQGGLHTSEHCRSDPQTVQS